MLEKLRIKMSSAKALKYFKMCDVDDSGEIDFEEFRVALFACDPNNGNPIGFAPNNLLTPMDAFEMFDEDGTGTINEDEFFFVLEYLKLEVSDEKQEQMFLKYDKDGSGRGRNQTFFRDGAGAGAPTPRDQSERQHRGVSSSTPHCGRVDAAGRSRRRHGRRCGVVAPTP